MHPFFFTSIIALFALVRPAVSFGDRKRGIVPTASGQIGVNPVDPLTDLGFPPGWIGVNTEYLTDLVDNGKTSTKWIGVNTEYLTQVVAPEMNPATPTATLSVVTTSVGAIASTATAAGQGLNPGDVSVTISPALLAKLKALAVEVCGSPAQRKLAKRDGAQSCAYEFANRVSAPGGPMEFDIDLPTISASDVAAVLSAIGKTQVPTSGAVGVALIFWYVWDETGDMPNTVKIPQSDIGPSNTPSTPATTSNSACPTGSNSPVCQDSVRCNSPNSATCTTSVKYETCSCLNYINTEGHPATPTNLLAAQSNLASMSSFAINAMTTSMAPPNCMADGAPWFLPTSWCDCGSSARYPTLPPASDATATTANCAYTVLPTATINPTSNTGVAAPTDVPGTNGVSGCAMRLASNEGLPAGSPNYCFCGGGPNVGPADAPLLTHTSVNPPVTDCAYTVQPTAGWSPTPPPPPPAAASPTPATPTCMSPGIYNMRASSAVAAASTYCSHIASQASAGAKIANNWPGSCSYQNIGAVYQPPKSSSQYAGMSNIDFTAAQDTVNDFCKGASVKIDEGDCNLALNTAINGCDTDTTDTKHGGRASVNCMMYTISPMPFGNSYPCEGQFCSYGWVQKCVPP